MKRVFLFASTDNAQQHYLLAKAMRDYLGWDAMSMVDHKTYLDYPTDWKLEDNLVEANEFIQTSDLIILQDIFLDVEGLDIKKYANLRNTIINGTGSAMRNNTMMPHLQYAQQVEGWAIVPCLADETLSMKLCAPPFENWIVPVEKILELSQGIEKPDDIVSVCHAPTALGIKGTKRIEEILRPLIESGQIKYERITKLSWEEAIKAKAKHHIILDSFGDLTCTYGAGNALEGLVLGQTVISKISPWAYCLHPDLPMVTTWGRDETEVIENQIKQYYTEIKQQEDMNDMFYQEYTRKWVEEHFSAHNKVEKWKHYINWVETRKMT